MLAEQDVQNIIEDPELNKEWHTAPVAIDKPISTWVREDQRYMLQVSHFDDHITLIDMQNLTGQQLEVEDERYATMFCVSCLTDAENTYGVFEDTDRADEIDIVDQIELTQ